jgi:hypothetical protein
MNFRQILLKHNPIDSKNKLNKLLAEVERNFGVFSRDMELDILAGITKDEVKEYFARIIHDPHPKLEYDSIQSKGSKLSEEKKEVRKKAKRNPLSPITMDRDDYGKSPARLPQTDKMLRELAKNGRDYSRPTLESQISKSRQVEGKERPKQWIKIVSIPMGGMNKR